MNGFFARATLGLFLGLSSFLISMATAEIIDDQPVEKERTEKTPVVSHLPTLWIIGDSTVRCGTPGQRGWGDEMSRFFDAQKIQVQNRAIGGRSARTFFTEGKWDAVLQQIKAGDWVIMQFGHNDASPINENPPITASTRARGSIQSNGEETKEIVNILTGKPETVHSYGWYLRHFAKTAQAKGASAIILSPVPRLVWTKGKTIRRSTDSWTCWAQQAAAQSGAHFFDLNDAIAKHYETMDEKAVRALFADGTHTTQDGALVSAEVVVEGLRQLPLDALHAGMRAMQK